MQGYEPDAYGDAMAEVYDDWYGDVSIRTPPSPPWSSSSAPAGAGVSSSSAGTGRLASRWWPPGWTSRASTCPRPCSTAFRAWADAVTLVHGDMATELPDGPFAVVLVAFNTFFSLTTADAQHCLASIAGRPRHAAASPSKRSFLTRSASTPACASRGAIAHRHLAVLTVSRHDAELQRAEGQFVELSEAGGVRLRLWSLRYAGPAELDRMAAVADLELVSRWSPGRRALDADSANHVSLYRRAGSADAQDGFTVSQLRLNL